MRHTPVLVFGAGATKDCGGPLTNEILPEAFNVANFLEQQASLKLLREFLDDNFLKPRMNQEDYPALPLLLGLL
jgi:hypothetical protein